MYRIILPILIAVISLSSVACSSLQTEISRNIADFTNNPAKVICYSGGQIIYEGTSQGKVSSEEGSDGYAFTERDTGDLVEVSGTCTVRYK